MAGRNGLFSGYKSQRTKGHRGGKRQNRGERRRDWERKKKLENKRGKKNWGDRRKKEDPNRQTQGQPREHREEEIIKKPEQRDYRDQSFSFLL
jgi:hypothetical protein